MSAVLAQERVSHRVEGVLSRDAAQTALFAAAGETWELRLSGLGGQGELAVIDPRSGASAAQAAGGAWLRWTAAETGVWRVEIRSAAAKGAFTLTALRLEGALGGSAEPAPLELKDARSAVGQGVIDWPGDDDWFALWMNAGERYAIYTVLGSLDGTRGEVWLPDAASPLPLWVHANGQTSYREVTAAADGLALVRVSGAQGGVGSFALGVSGLDGGELRRTPASEAPRLAEHRLREASVVSEPGELVADLRGAWAPFGEGRWAGVWLDTDLDGIMDHAALTDDGWRVRLWSQVERRWLDVSAPLESSGFDSLRLRIPTRGFGSQVRWQAVSRDSRTGWRSLRGGAGVVETRPPRPGRPALWPVWKRPGTPSEREAALSEAGVGAELDNRPLVVLDPGHGGEETGWLTVGLSEADSNLALAQALAALLEAEGVRVLLTRTDAGLARFNFSGEAGRADLHARVELAHLAGADLFVSLHSNAAHDEAQRGLEGWYYPNPGGGWSNRALSDWLLAAAAAALGEWGYATHTLTIDSSCWEIVAGYCDPLYVLAPYLLVDYASALDWGGDPQVLGLSADPWAAPLPVRYPITAEHTKGVGWIDLIDPKGQAGPAAVVRGTMMPAVLLELLYMTHEPDLQVLHSAEAREALAQGLAEGALSWLRR